MVCDMEKVATIVLLLVSLQCLVCKCNTWREYWVRSTQSDTTCPEKNGTKFITLSDIVQSPSHYLRSNTVIRFCPGTHTSNRTTSIPILPVNDGDNITLAGCTESARATTVDCGWNLSFAFRNVRNTALSDMTFVNCGLEIPNDWIRRHTSRQWQQIQRGTHAALFLRNTKNVSIRNIHILRSNGYGLLGLNALNSSIIGCRFEDNYWKIGRSPTCRDQQTRSGGNALFLLSDIRGKDADIVDITILYTEFARGTEREIQGIKASGGGLGFYLSSRKLTQARFLLVNCTFNNNTAPNGGNLIFITGRSLPSRVYLHVESCRFHNGKSEDSGGGMYLAIDPHNEADLVVNISNATFDHNTANQKGGAIYMNISVERKALSLSIINCNFTNNAARQGSAIMISPITGEKPLEFSDGTLLSGLMFSNNGPQSTIDCSSTIFLKESQSGVLHLNRVEFIKLRNVIFKDNHNCSALYVKGSDIVFLEKIEFINNTGRIGAGIALIASRNSVKYPYLSTLKLEQNTTVRMINNTAEEYGGGIMVNDDCKVGDNCFFQIDPYQDCFNNNLSCGIHFEMINNTAGLGGDSIFGRCFEACYPYSGKQQGLLNFANRDNMTALQSFFSIHVNPSPSEIAAFPSRVCFCNDKVDCSSVIYVNVSQGEKFNVNVSAVWQHRFSSTAIIRARIIPENSGATGERQSIQEVGKTCRNLTYSIETDRDNVTLILSVEGGQNSGVPHYAVVDVHFLKCPKGFELRRSAKAQGPPKCRCAKHIENRGIVCDITNKTIHIPAPMWIGDVSWADDVVLHMNCPLGYCKPNDIDVKLSEPDDQCSLHRTGVLCGKCQPGFSLTLGTSHCQKCSDTSLWLLIVFAIAGVALLCMLLICNFTVSTGTYSGLIFYANIIRGINATFFLPENRFLKPITVVLSTFIAWLNLDFGISACFYDGLNAYHMALLQFVFPVYIWILVTLLICVSRCSITLSKLTGSNTVSVLATLFLLSYAKLLRAIIVAVSATTLTNKDGSSKLHWLQDANLLYMQSLHIALFIMGVIAIVIYALPFTLLVLLAPWLQGQSNHRLLRWVNRLKPLLDTYQGPYNDKFRYWTGLMLVLRAILFIIFATNVQSDPRIDLFAVNITVLGLLLFWLSTSRKFGGVYKEVKLDMINSFFLVNLVIFASGTLFLKTSEHSAPGKPNQAILATFMVGSAFIVFSCILIHHFYQLLTSKIKYFQLGRNAAKNSEANPSQVVGVQELPEECSMQSLELNGSMSSALREPLLEQM